MSFQRGFKARCEVIAKQQRQQLKLLPSSPLNPFQLAAHLGVRVLKITELAGLSKSTLKVLTEDDPSSWSAVTLFDGVKKLVILNSSHSPGRNHGNLMHELAHLIMNHKASRTDISQDGRLLLEYCDQNLEKEADWLAGCLLLPREALISIKRKSLGIDQAMKDYYCSKKMLEFRLRVTGVEAQILRGQRVIR